MLWVFCLALAHFSYKEIVRVLIVSLSKGCFRRSWNIWPTRTKRFPRRSWAYRRTWSTRCKGNTEELCILTLIYFIIPYTLFNSVPILPFLIFFISLSLRVLLVPLESREQRASQDHWCVTVHNNIHN